MQVLKKFPSDKINGAKNDFFFRELILIAVLLLICDSHISGSTKFVSLKLSVEFSIFDSVSFLLKFIFSFNKMHGLLKRHNSFQNYNNRKTTHNFTPRPLISTDSQTSVATKSVKIQ